VRSAGASTFIIDCRGPPGAVRDPSRYALSRLVWLCRECHRWAERHRSLAGGLGLLVRHGITPCAAIPVFHHGCWALLDDCGGVIPVDPSREGETLGRADAVVFGDES